MSASRAGMSIEANTPGQSTDIYRERPAPGLRDNTVQMARAITKIFGRVRGQPKESQFVLINSEVV